MKPSNYLGDKLRRVINGRLKYQLWLKSPFLIVLNLFTKKGSKFILKKNISIISFHEKTITKGNRHFLEPQKSESCKRTNFTSVGNPDAIFVARKFKTPKADKILKSIIQSLPNEVPYKNPSAPSGFWWWYAGVVVRWSASDTTSRRDEEGYSDENSLPPHTVLSSLRA